MIADGRFRQDLFYRLNIFPIDLPALRERGEDVILLAESLLDRVAGGRLLSLSEEVQDWLCRYSFPGNVRELRNLLERACLLCDGDEIRPQHLPVALLAKGGLRTVIKQCQSPPPTSFVQKMPTALSFAEQVWAFTGARKALASHLGLSERTLYRRLLALRTKGVLE
jgi:two-component system, NtrC family, response regulator HydG